MRYHYFVNYVAYLKNGISENDCLCIMQHKITSNKQLDTIRKFAVTQLTNKYQINIADLRKIVIRNFILLKKEREKENVPQ